MIRVVHKVEKREAKELVDQTSPRSGEAEDVREKSRVMAVFIRGGELAGRCVARRYNDGVPG